VGCLYLHFADVSHSHPLPERKDTQGAQVRTAKWWVSLFRRKYTITTLKHEAAQAMHLADRLEADIKKIQAEAMEKGAKAVLTNQGPSLFEEEKDE
jgi:hypothetical protein